MESVLRAGRWSGLLSPSVKLSVVELDIQDVFSFVNVVELRDTVVFFLSQNRQMDKWLIFDFQLEKKNYTFSNIAQKSYSLVVFIHVSNSLKNTDQVLD